jgi:tetratricopeptide (TPR) repeat protein
MRRSVLHGRRNTTGVDHHLKLAHALMDYAVSLKDLGKANEALGLLEEALTIYESSMEFVTIDLLYCKATIAQLYHSEGREVEAIKIGRETLESRRQLLGETHPHTIFSMSDQAAFLAQASRFDESKKEIGRAVELAREHLGEDHRTTISIAIKAAALYRDMGLTDTAEEMSYLGIHEAKRLLGVDHPETISATFLYSQIQFQQGEHLVAMEGMRLCILRSKREHGERHFLTLYREAELAAVENIHRTWK